ncbi:MAG: hypothetical protein Q7T54_02795 [Candidatus Levybacteria bacterium]|nr:hypothetical protein [Candidatus Levybacteria bacterium]
MDSLFVSITGFLIKIIFIKDTSKKPIPEYLRYKFKSEILYILGSFISEDTNKTPDFTIYFYDVLQPEQVIRKTDKHFFVYHYKETSSTSATGYYQMSISQFEIMLSNILYKLLTKNNGFGIHASAVEIQGKAYIFLGKSGAGKSTISQFLGKKFRILSDDLIFIRKINKSFFAFQTPFMERNVLVVKSPFPTLLSKIFFLRKNNHTSLLKIKDNKSLHNKILKSVRIGDNEVSLSKTINQLLSNDEMFYMLSFEKNEKKIIDFFQNTIITEDYKTFLPTVD